MKALAVLALSAAAAVAQNPSVAVDINGSGTILSSNPAQYDRFWPVGSRLFFPATTLQGGWEPWFTDGTTAGTASLGDLNPGMADSNPTNFQPVLINGRLEAFFVAETATAGQELWRTDGTPSGTRMIIDLEPGAAPGGAHGTEWTVAVMNGKVYFRGARAATGPELFESDGTAAGTRLVADLLPGSQGSWPAQFLVDASGTRLFFTTGLPPSELWVTDGTSAGTASLGTFSGIYGMARLGNSVVVNGATAAEGYELWITDGTPSGTRLVTAINPGPADAHPWLFGSVEWGGLRYFSAVGPSGHELYRTDGTAAGTVLVADIEPGPRGSGPGAITVLPAGLVFAAYTSTTGSELHLYDGVGPPRLVADLNPGLARSRIEWPCRLGNDLVFIAEDATGYGVFRFTPGTGIAPLHRFAVRPEKLTAVGNGRCVFPADDGIQCELWATDGTVAGTGMIADLDPTVLTGHANPGILGRVGDTLVLRADGGTGDGGEPWAWSPTRGALALGDLYPGVNTSEPRSFASTDTFAFFAARSIDGVEPFAWQVASSQATPLGNLAPGLYSSNPEALAVLGEEVLFSAYAPTAGRELWATDGTVAGTRRIVDLEPGPVSGVGLGAIAFRDRVLFVGQTATGGSEPWITDGTASGTTRIADVHSGSGSSSPGSFVSFGGEIWFAATTPNEGREWWATDGTVAGTRLAIDVRSGVAGSSPENPIRVGDRLVFTAESATAGREVHVTDGTAMGTILLGDIWPGPSASSALRFVRAGDRVFFVADDGTHGPELWVSDLTPAGTHMVVDLEAGASGSQPDGLIACGDRVYFRAGSLDAYYVTDGTAAGTVAVWTSAPVPSSGIAVAGTVYATGLEDPYVGTELFAILDPGAMVEDLGDACGPHWTELEARAPTLGGTMRLDGFLAPAGSSGFTLLAGPAASRAQFPGIVAPTCWSHALPFDDVLAATTTARWTASVQVPNQTSLLGLSVVIQSYYLGGPAVTTSNALRATIGW